MKGAPLALARPDTVDGAIALLREAGPDARALAGGQSLMPLMAMRRVSPTVLVDLARVAGLDHITLAADGVVRVGAMTRQRAVEHSTLVASHVALLPTAVQHIAHHTVRNQGTLGGSIAHADPAAELPCIALATEATMLVAGAGGERRIAAGDFFTGRHATAMAADELLLEVQFPPDPPGAGCAFEEVSRRPGDVAIVGAAAMLCLTGGRISTARVVLSSVAPVPLRVGVAESMLRGEHPSAELFAAAAAIAAAGIDPPGDLNGTTAYRRHLAGVLVRRTLTVAAERARR